ncbi:O-antigen polymerase [Maribacter luteus]|uniref:Oligosaccharide repeat unit polymerase n=1 Tax=Maribacter luteus TaxID=2594478 RepID=A0A6I2MP85_9FLAO|nr:O-antigen polymerase [Maribacter luteus]MRX64305.1 hypothetical protein [Maribacter luteus]
MFRLRNLINPGVIVALSSLLSFLGWLILSEKMYYTLKKPFSLFSFGVFLAFIWYCFAIFISFLGFKTGNCLKIKSSFVDKNVSIDSDLVYKTIVVLAAIGSLYSLGYIISKVGGFGEVVELILNNNANFLKKNLYKDYSIGIRSLRYVSIHAVTLMIIRRLIFKKKRIILDVFALVTLLITATISSRLSIVMMSIQTILILVIYNKIRIKFRNMVLGGILFYLVISVFNYTRNYNFYSEKVGLNFFEAGAADMIVYLGTPFQGAVSVGENHETIKEQPMNWPLYSGIPSSLTTNSSFLYYYRDYGWWCFMVAGFLLFVYAFFAGVFAKFRYNILFLIYTSIMYIFAEFWRIDMFFEGVMITLLLTPILASFIVISMKLLRHVNTGKN